MFRIPFHDFCSKTDEETTCHSRHNEAHRVWKRPKAVRGLGRIKSVYLTPLDIDPPKLTLVPERAFAKYGPARVDTGGANRFHPFTTSFIFSSRSQATFGGGVAVRIAVEHNQNSDCLFSRQVNLGLCAVCVHGVKD